MEVSQAQEAQSSMRSGMTHRSAANGERATSGSFHKIATRPGLATSP
jgi:hypothetical protein